MAEAERWTKMKYDLGILQVSEEQKLAKAGLNYLYIQCQGRFDGFGEGPDGKVSDYFTRLPEKSNWIIVDLSETILYSDLAPVLIKNGNRILRDKEGGLAICSPNEPLRQVLDLAGLFYFEDEASAVRSFEKN